MSESASFLLGCWDKGDGELPEREFRGSEGEELVAGGAQAMAEALQCRQEPQTQVSFHCQPIEALRGRGHEENQPGRSFFSAACFGSVLLFLSSVISH